MKKRLFLLLIPFMLTGCYQMPTDDDYCVIPTTNNPGVTGQKQQATPMPSATY